jgi:hypothetical protein
LQLDQVEVLDLQPLQRVGDSAGAAAVRRGLAGEKIDRDTAPSTARCAARVAVRRGSVDVVDAELDSVSSTWSASPGAWRRVRRHRTARAYFMARPAER